MQEIIAVPNSTFYLKRRNETANIVIEKYAMHHRFMDIENCIAEIFISKDDILAALAPIAAQAPLIYQPLVKELSCIYSATPDMIMQGLVIDTVTITMISDLKNKFIIEFGPEFILELLHEIWSELGIGAVADLQPVIGDVAVAIFDATFATTLIWQIGTMTAMYFMNDEEWIASKQETRRRARKQTGLPSPRVVRPEVLKAIPQKNPEINEKITRGVENTIHIMKESDPTMTHEHLRFILREKGIGDDFIETGLQRVIGHH
jgi:uncharacterized protein (DUF697 family)